MRNILEAVKPAVKLTGEIRKARKAGASAVQIRPMPAWVNTIEGCQTHELGRDIDRAVMEVFKGLPYEVQRRLEFTPEGPGAWVKRARFWQQELRPVLPPKTYHAVMASFASWYARCLRMRASTAIISPLLEKFKGENQGEENGRMIENNYLKQYITKMLDRADERELQAIYMFTLHLFQG